MILETWITSMALIADLGVYPPNLSFTIYEGILRVAALRPAILSMLSMSGLGLRTPPEQTRWLLGPQSAY